MKYGKERIYVKWMYYISIWSTWWRWLAIAIAPLNINHRSVNHRSRMRARCSNPDIRISFTSSSVIIINPLHCDNHQSSSVSIISLLHFYSLNSNWAKLYSPFAWRTKDLTCCRSEKILHKQSHPAYKNHTFGGKHLKNHIISKPPYGQKKYIARRIHLAFMTRQMLVDRR